MPTFNLASARERLNNLFDEVELDALCLDRFPDVYEKFSVGMRKDAKITLLLDYCRRNPADWECLESLVRADAPAPQAVVRGSISTLRKSRTWLWLAIGIIAGGLSVFGLGLAVFGGQPTPGKLLTTPVPSKVETTSTANHTSTPEVSSGQTAVPGTTYGFEDGTLQGWRAWDKQDVLTIQDLTVTEAVSFAGRQALQVNVKGLSSSWGATIYLLNPPTPARVFSVKLRLSSPPPAGANVWAQLAIASAEGWKESNQLYLSRDSWHTIEWDTSSYGWGDDLVRAIYIQFATTNTEYDGMIYVDEIHIE